MTNRSLAAVGASRSSLHYLFLSPPVQPRVLGILGLLFFLESNGFSALLEFPGPADLDLRVHEVDGADVVEVLEILDKMLISLDFHHFLEGDVGLEVSLDAQAHGFFALLD